MAHRQAQNFDSEYYAGSNANPNSSQSELPPFESFPQAQARDRGTSSRTQTASHDPVAHGSSHRYQAVDDVSIHPSRHRSVVKNSTQSQRQRTTTLPAFTPFPAAAPNSRYAPPEGSRAAQVQPIPPPAFVPESTTSGYLPLPPPDAIRYPR